MNLDSTINKVQELTKTYPSDTPEYRVLNRTIKQLRKLMKKGIKKS